MRIRTKPREAGPVLDAVEFTGDPSIHKGIFTEEYKDYKTYRIKCQNTSASMMLDIGDVIIDTIDGPVVISKARFKKEYEFVT